MGPIPIYRNSISATCLENAWQFGKVQISSPFAFSLPSPSPALSPFPDSLSPLGHFFLHKPRFTPYTPTKIKIQPTLTLNGQKRGTPTLPSYPLNTSRWQGPSERFPMGRGAKPLYYLWEGEKYGYIPSRKKCM